MSKQGFIYKYTYPNGKVYIGQTQISVRERHYQHMSASKDPKRRTICEVAIAKYGEPKLETIETIEVADNEVTKLVGLLNEAEKKWITEYDSTNRTKGYNIQNGGERVTPEEFILQEKWYEIFENEGYGYQLGYVRELLDSIIEKNGNMGEDGEIIDFHLKSSDMTKEERQVWYGIKFIGGWEEKEMTFNSFIKTCPIADYLEDIVGNAFNDYTEHIRQIIWKQIMKKKDRIIKDYFKK